MPKRKPSRAADKLRPIVRCSSCIHYHHTRLWDGREAGDCHRHAPRPWVGNLEWEIARNGQWGCRVINTLWPLVFHDDYCGDHTPNNSITGAR